MLTLYAIQNIRTLRFYVRTNTGYLKKFEDTVHITSVWGERGKIFFDYAEALKVKKALTEPLYRKVLGTFYTVLPDFMESDLKIVEYRQVIE